MRIEAYHSLSVRTIKRIPFFFLECLERFLTIHILLAIDGSLKDLSLEEYIQKHNQSL